MYVLPVKQQVNSVDCGCHAIACAVEFLCNDGDPLSNFDVDKMREHLAKCLESENLAPFPKSLKKIRGRRRNVITLTVTV